MSLLDRKSDVSSLFEMSLGCPCHFLLTVEIKEGGMTVEIKEEEGCTQGF